MDSPSCPFLTLFPPPLLLFLSPFSPFPVSCFLPPLVKWLFLEPPQYHGRSQVHVWTVNSVNICRSVGALRQHTPPPHPWTVPFSKCPFDINTIYLRENPNWKMASPANASCDSRHETVPSLQRMKRHPRPLPWLSFQLPCSSPPTSTRCQKWCASHHLLLQRLQEVAVASTNLARSASSPCCATCETKAFSRLRMTVFCCVVAV